jgi:hypothetical protein
LKPIVRSSPSKSSPSRPDVSVGGRELRPGVVKASAGAPPPPSGGQAIAIAAHPRIASPAHTRAGTQVQKSASSAATAPAVSTKPDEAATNFGLLTIGALLLALLVGVLATAGLTFFGPAVATRLRLPL